MTNMLTPEQNIFPVIIPALHPIKNVLQGFKKYHNFSKIWDYMNTGVIHIIQVGAGGTGGYTAVDIMRFIGNLPKEVQKCIYYTLIDGDKFEPKNLGRQLCQEEDVGINKAEAIVTNYSNLFGCIPENVSALPEYLKSVDQLNELLFGFPSVRKNFTIYDECADNNECEDNKANNEDNSNQEQDIDILNSEYNSQSIINKINKHTNSTNNTITITTNEFNSLFTDIPALNSSSIFYDKKLHYSIHINNYKSNRLTLNTTNINGLIPNYNVFSSRDIKYTKFVPVIVDCTDNNTVRNIIYAAINSLNSCYSSTKDLVIDTIRNKENEIIENSYFSSQKLKNEVKAAAIDSNLNKFGIYIDATDRLCIADNNKSILGLTSFSNCNEYHGFSYSSDNFKKLESVYLVASGNGKYKGQVGWGRYCLSPFNSVLSSNSVFKYHDLWGNNLHKGSFMSHDAKVKLENDDLNLNKIFSNNNMHVYLYDTNSQDNFMCKALKLSNFITNNTEDVDDDIVNKILKSKYYYFSLRHGDDFYSTEWMTNVLKPLGYNFYPSHSLYPCYYNKSTYYAELHNADIDIRYSDAFMYNRQSTDINSFNSISGNIIDFNDRFRNFTDWVSQFISVPLPYEIYPEMLDITSDEKEENMSCAERAEQNIQFINANKTASNIVVQYVTNIINGLFSLETPNCEEFRIDTLSTEFDTYTGKVQNKNITSTLLLNNKISLKDSSLEIIDTKDVRGVWHKYNK